MFNFGLEVLETHLRTLDPLEITRRAYTFFKNHDIGIKVAHSKSNRPLMTIK